MAVVEFLVDNSALNRMQYPAVEAVLAPLIEQGRVATTGVLDLEALYSERIAVLHYDADFDLIASVTG